MTLNAVGIGYNIALVNLVNVKCREGHVRVGQRDYSDTGFRDQALYASPKFSIFGNPTIYRSVLTDFNLLNNTTSQITWYALSPTLLWTRYNGIAIQPEPGVEGSWTRFFLRDFTIFIRDLVQI